MVKSNLNGCMEQQPPAASQAGAFTHFGALVRLDQEWLADWVINNSGLSQAALEPAKGYDDNAAH